MTSNPHIRSGLTWSAIRWAFTSFYAANWHPFTWLSHIVDFSLFGPQAWGHHLSSVIFHSANVVLLFLFLSKATGSTWRSAVVAILFGVHPLHVESVAWVAERKDVLNTFFALLTLLAYLRWTQCVDRGSKIWYFVALLCFALSLGSKGMSVTLPILLLLLDYWPLGRLQSIKTIRGFLIEKLPFIVLSIAVSGVTIVAQNSGGALKALVPLSTRCSNAAVSIPRYLFKLVWPHDLAVYYPYAFPSSVAVLLSLVLIVGASAAAFYWRKTFPWLFVGWYWFLVSVLPVIGIIQIGTQSIADRYLYWSSIGPTISVVWAFGWLGDKFWIVRKSLAPAACGIAIALGALTQRQLGFWKSSETLFQHNLAVTSNNALGHLNLGVALGNRGANNEALFHLREAVRIAPTYPDARVNLGMALREAGRFSEAIPEFEIAIQLKPDYGKAHANLAITLHKENDFSQAISEYQKALQLDPISPEIRVAFGLALQGSGQIEAALAQFEEAIKEESSFAGAHSNRGIVLEKLGRLEESITEYRKALSLDPKNSDASLNLPVVLFKAGHVDDAIAQVRKLIEQRPDYAEGYFNLGGMLYSKDDFDGAIAAYKRALELKPDYPDAWHNLSVALEGKSSAKR